MTQPGTGEEPQLKPGGAGPDLSVFGLSQYMGQEVPRQWLGRDAVLQESRWLVGQSGKKWLTTQLPVEPALDTHSTHPPSLRA